MHDLVTAEAFYDAAGSRLQGTENTYELRLQADPLDFVQRKLNLPTANGNHIYLNPVDFSSEINGHSINNILKNFPYE